VCLQLVPNPSSDRVAQAALGELPSPRKSEVPTHRAAPTPSPVVRSHHPKEVPPYVQITAQVSPLAPATPACPLVSRRGRPTIPPKGLMDYVP
jgi:hypothetical protein